MATLTLKNETKDRLLLKKTEKTIKTGKTVTFDEIIEDLLKEVEKAQNSTKTSK